MDDRGELIVFSFSAHPELAQRISNYLGAPLGGAHVGRFPDGEINFRSPATCAGRPLIVQPTWARR